MKHYGLAGAVLATCVLTALLAVGSASATQKAREFYLAARVHQCLLSNVHKAHVTVVPCSNPSHRLEVYAIGHGGWGSHPPAQSAALAIARTVCLNAFQRRTGHPLGSAWGWNAFWPDPGAQSRRYGDKIICSLRTWPRFSPLGAGWHVH